MDKDIKLELVNNFEGFFRLEEEWKELLKQTNLNSIFLTWEWVFAWWKYFGHNYKLWLIIARSGKDGRLAGIAPLVLKERSLIKKYPCCYTFSFLGAGRAAGDYIEFIIKPGLEEIIGSLFVEYLVSNCKGFWPLVRLDGVLSESRMVELFRKNPSIKKIHIHRDVCPYVLLPDSWEDYISHLGAKNNRNLRRVQRKLEREYGDAVQYKAVTSENDLNDYMTNAFLLHQKVRKSHGEAGSFNDPAMREFHREVAGDFLKKGWLRLYFLSVAGENVAMAYCFFRNRILYSYSVGYDPDWKSYGVGKLVYTHAIKQGISDGAEEFDFLRGDHPYKYYWTDKMRNILFLRLSPAPMGSLLIDLYRSARGFRRFWRKIRKTG